MGGNEAAPPAHPKLKRLASKPLKLAASSFRPLVSRGNSSTTLVHPDAADDDASTAPPTAQKHRRGLRRPRPLRSSAHVMTPAQIATAARGPRKPLDGEEAAAWVRVRVVKAEGLVAKDRNGTSDPFVTLLLPPTGKGQTPVMKKTLNPVFDKTESTFDFPLYLSLASFVGGRGLEGVVWDKEYMGEISFPMTDWFPPGDVQLWREDLPLLTRRVISTRKRHQVSGTVSLQIGFVPSQDTSGPEEAVRKARMVYSTMIEQSTAARGLAGVLAIPAHQGIGTVKMRGPVNESATLESAADAIGGHPARALLHSATAAVVSPLAGGQHKMEPVPGNVGAVEHDDYEDEYDVLADDGMSTSSSSDEFEDALDDEDHEALSRQESPEEDIHPPPRADSSSSDTTRVGAGLADKSKAKRQTSVPEYFDTHRQDSESPASTPMTGVSTPGGSKRRIFRKGSKKKTKEKKASKRDFNFDSSPLTDVLGIVVLEIQRAQDLPKLKNGTLPIAKLTAALKFSFDMDPFVVISFGKKVFRTRVIRHSLNPTWDEKLLFHVRRHESAYTIQMAVLDWDKVSGNDFIGTSTVSLDQLVADAPAPDEKTGLYGKNEDGKHDFKEFTLPVLTAKDMPWEAKHSPTLTIRAKYEPYDALRQKFWRQYIAQYDVDETGTMSYTELTAMLDSLGSTLTRRTIEGYFHTWNKSADKDELTINELIQCLEREVTKTSAEKAKVKPVSDEIVTGTQTPSMAPEPKESGIAMAGPDIISSPVDAKELTEQILASQPRTQGLPADGTNGAGNMEAVESEVPIISVRKATEHHSNPNPGGADEMPSGTITPGMMSDDGIDSNGEQSDSLDFERIINIRTCPLCHRPRLKRKSERDIITHLAICASNDWSRVDRIVTANYVTSSQAQRKFLTKLMNKVTIGAYSLGANSANILVQDRLSGQLQEEKMAVYVRLGIRVLYKGWRGHMEGARAKRLLKSLSVKQGIKYDSPASALDIPAFIAFHNLNVDEILDPLDSFKTFNEFFYRKLKPSARPVAEAGNEYRLVSCADCRMMAFASVEEATKIWIKGREFSVGRLLGPRYKDIWDRYNGGGLAIFRLAPQDYHRFHSPVKGTVGKMTLIDGEYYTVNPQAIRTMLDVYGENVRKVVPVHSEEFGTVMTVWVGAMMVGSILTTVEEGQTVGRADELGYFAFGGSTIVCLFEKGVLEFDQDLLDNGRASIETLVRMGSGIGRSTRKPKAV